METECLLETVGFNNTTECVINKLECQMKVGFRLSAPRVATLKPRDAKVVQTRGMERIQ